MFNPHLSESENAYWQSKLDSAMRTGFQKDLRLLAEQIRQANPDRSPDFSDGVDWAALYLEDLANDIAEGGSPEAYEEQESAKPTEG